MHSTPELLKTVMADRDRWLRDERLARLAACVRACCRTSRLDRLARALGRTPAAC